MSTRSTGLSEGLTPSDKSTFIEAHRLLSTARSRSRVVIVGPFEPQIFELSSSESGFSSDSTDSSRSSSRGSLGTMISPTTPTRAKRPVGALVDSPATATDWVAYGEAEEGFEDLDCDRSGIASSDVSFQLKIEQQGVVCDENGNDSSEPPSMILEEGVAHLDRLPPLKSAKHDQSAVPELLGMDILRSIRNNPQPAHPSPPLKLIPIAIPSIMEWQDPPSSGATTPMYSCNSGDSDWDVEYDKPSDRWNAEADLLPTNEYICSACEGRGNRMIRLLPCQDLACPPCFSSSVAAVSVTQGVSKCPACLKAVASFEPYQPSSYVPVRASAQPSLEKTRPSDYLQQPVPLRLDNIAWDVEPHLVESFLPPNSLPENHPHPIHICLDRRDGRTKDYMYVEVASQAAARRVLQLRQNAYMPGGKVTGGRKRAVTISQVTQDELIRELRPGSKAELLSLLELCEATLTTASPQLRVDAAGRGRLHASVGANGKAHYIKYRHAPFHSLLSLMSKLCGRDSPSYWDIYHVATGAISALSSLVNSSSMDPHGDRKLLQRLIAMFDSTFDKSRQT